MARPKGRKLAKCTWPNGHSPEDFKCFGPPATEDGVFDTTMLCDMGCFKQGDIDTNKYYHGAVVQSKKDNAWYAYFEYGRTGSSTHPQFQVIEGPDKETALSEYAHQMHAKNDRRGEWVNRGSLGKVLQPKTGKDCYLVRPQATRSTGLPDARTIVHGVTKKTKKSTKSKGFDSHSTKLLSDLNLATTNYTRSSMVNDAIPTEEVFTKGRNILNEATKVANKLKSDAGILKSKDLGDLTGMMYSLIPKKKGQKLEKSDWWLTPTNISSWRSDLDAFEQALAAQDGVETISNLPFELEHICMQDGLGKKVKRWMEKATQNRHSHLRSGMKLCGIWKVKRETYPNFLSCQKKIAGSKPTLNETPLHQTTRFDLDDDSDYVTAGTHMLFHGTRTVNVTGILSSGLRLPKQLSNVSINGAMFGSGLYFADDWKKSAGYCSYSGSYYASGSVSKRKAFMFICDVVIGRTHVASRPQGFTGPPSGHHSIFGKSGYSVANNEFIIFNGDQQNLRYLVEFDA